MIFASKTGDIALWQQAKFPARWKGQGLYVMPGEDSSYDWQGYIPQQENPHVINPETGYIESANQRPVDSSYPYFIPGNYILNRGRILDKALSNMQNITPQDMMRLQNDVYSVFAAEAVPFMIAHLNTNSLNEKGNSYLNELRGWNFQETADSKASTIFHAWWDSLGKVIWNDEYARVQQPNVRPDAQTLLEMLLRDSSFKYADNINTPQVETVSDAVTAAFQSALQGLQKEEAENGLLWWKHKNPTVRHLLRESVMPFARSGLHVGGWNNTINAVTNYHGPSWRMVVQLSTPTEAYGVYPGGESGNPGSKFYDNFVDSWVEGKYYTLWLMKESEANDKRVKWKMTFTNS
jgi:penicillin amidase